MTDATPPPRDDEAGREAARSRRRRWRVIALCVLIPTLFTLSTLLYLDERDARQARHQFGVRTAADWVELEFGAWASAPCGLGTTDRSSSWATVSIFWAVTSSSTQSAAVRTRTVILVHTRPGLIWPALGWMAATLFALVSLRNAAPGSPPIGSLIDYLAFFWAEGIIAVSVTATAATGIQTERHRHKMED